MVPELVTDKLDQLPLSPGVYLFKDKSGTVVYIGKAKNLRSRVRSYFQSSSDARAFIPILLRTVGDLDTIMTGSEKEAAILENNLIKEHRPKYNVKLRDDKEFLCVRLSTGHAWPRLDLVRRPESDGARYFGPYHSATAARRTLHLVNKHFQLRTCGDLDFASRRRPCLQHQIKRCPAPCVLPVDEGWYREQVEAVALFLSGRHDELSDEVDKRMRAAAHAMRFELAAVYRDQLRAVETVREQQRIVAADRADRDVVGLYREGDLIEVSVLHIREGRLSDVSTVSIRGAEIFDEEVIAAFIAQRYVPKVDDAAVAIPPEILLPCEPEGVSGIADWLSEHAGHKVAIAYPQRGKKAEILKLANDNARHSFQEKSRRSIDLADRLAEVQEALRLEILPRRIECCDISHLGGGDVVGAIVAMENGALARSKYRTFHVRGPASDPAVAKMATRSGDALNDDYGAIYEVLARRFRRSKSDDVDWSLPDLFVVDGGRGQLGVALAAAHDLGLHDLAICGLAKERETVSGDKMVDRVYLPGQKNPVPLRPNTATFHFLTQLRDEAHRVSNAGRKKLGKSRRFHSAIDDVPGIGKKTKTALLRHLGTLSALKAASDAALLAVDGVTTRHVRALRAAWGPPIETREVLPSVAASDTEREAPDTPSYARTTANDKANSSDTASDTGN